MVLKATTATHAASFDDDGNRTTFETQNHIGKDIYKLDEKSITTEIFKRSDTTLIFDVHQSQFISKKFMEETETGDHQSLIGVPIIKSNDEKIGVLRCINKKKKGAVLPVFVQRDKIFMEMIISFVSRFIENVEVHNEKTKFLTRLSHELSTPLHGLQSQIDYVEKVYFGKLKVKKTAEQFQYLKDQTVYLNYLIRDIDLRFGKELNLKSTYIWEKVDLFLIIHKIHDLLKSEAKFDRHIDIRITPCVIPDMYIDKIKFEQVIFNLVQNAIKYSIKGYHSIIITHRGHVRKEFEGDSNTQWQVIDIKNWGLGVLEEEKEIIFQEYKRGRNIRGVAPSGTGIGLAVSKEIIENHDGHLEVTNLKNPTIFSIFLPNYLKYRRSEE